MTTKDQGQTDRERIARLLKILGASTEDEGLLGRIQSSLEWLSRQGAEGREVANDPGEIVSGTRKGYGGAPVTDLTSRSVGHTGEGT